MQSHAMDIAGYNESETSKLICSRRLPLIGIFLETRMGQTVGERLGRLTLHRSGVSTYVIPEVHVWNAYM